MNIFSAENLSKSYSDFALFDSISFGMEDGEKLGIIGVNGSGKSTLLKIIAGMVEPDLGKVSYNRSVRIEYLAQMPTFQSGSTARQEVARAKPEVAQIISEYDKLCDTGENPDRINELSRKIDDLHAWNYMSTVEKVLSQIGIENPEQVLNTMSGGMQKRVAIAKAIISSPNLLILDEPTNHLDVASVQWLQDYLSEAGLSLLFITHDRYFLDAVANRIIEIDRNKIFHFPGNYEKYLEQKQIFIENENATIDSKLNKLRNELEWLSRGAPARRTKSKSKIQGIDKLQKEVVRVKDKALKIELGSTFLGKTIIEAHHIDKTVDGKVLFKDFTYIAQPGDRIGIIGNNGCGKSTLLRILAGEIKPDVGRINIGQTVKVGFFKQEIVGLDPDKTVINSIREIADFFKVGYKADEKITAKQMLEIFLFSAKKQNDKVGKLSGGEKKRLILAKLLMENPNVLFLDEPTNDFDIRTLNALEEYLDDFKGVLISVSHDRAFLDRTCDFIYSFENGTIKQYPGNYSDYLDKSELRKKAAINTSSEINEQKPLENQSTSPKKKKGLSYKEQKEFDGLEVKIALLEEEKSELSSKLIEANSDYKLIGELSDKLAEVDGEIEEKTMRWLELSELMNG